MKDEKQNSKYEYSAGEQETDSVKEAVPAYRYGKKTIEDFYAMPDDWKGELIDGVLYNMSTPRVMHQMMAMLIGHQLFDYVRKHNGNCLVLDQPLDTQLDRDEYTMVEPDVTVLCDRSKLVHGIYFGAPDMVIEILSPSTKRKDIFIKTPKYMSAGVREYWLVDPKTKTVTVYLNGSSVNPVRYTFADMVPVGIWDGKCMIDFPEIDRETADLREGGFE